VEAGVFGLVDGDAGDGFGAEVGEEAGGGGVDRAGADGFAKGGVEVGVGALAAEQGGEAGGGGAFEVGTLLQLAADDA
jgi:hypothetical protein